MTPRETYFRDLRRCRFLQPEEERALASEWRRTGALDLRERLVRAHLPLVVKIAAQYRRPGLDLDDLIQEGNVGLLRALDGFDPDRGVRLSTYAGFWIRAIVLKYVIDNRRLVRIGTTHEQRRVMFGLTKRRRELEQGGPPADLADLARLLDVDEERLAQLEQGLVAGETALDAPHPTRGGRRIDHWAAASEDRPDVTCEQTEEREVLRAALDEFEAELDPRTRRIFRARWEDEERGTLSQLGARFGVSRERVRQIDERTLHRLRTFLEARQTPFERQAA